MQHKSRSRYGDGGDAKGAPDREPAASCSAERQAWAREAWEPAAHGRRRTFPKPNVLSLRAAHGAVVAFAGDAPANAFSPGGFRRARVTWPSSIPRVAFRGRSGLLVDAADTFHFAA